MNIWPFNVMHKMRKRQRDLAWLARAAFERGYKSNGDDWRKDWTETPERDILMRWGYIKENDTWR